MNRLGLKISCFVVSFIIWMQVASTTMVEQSARMPLSIVGLGESYTVAGSDLPQYVEVKVEGSKLKLLAHKYFNRYVGEVRVNLADRAPGPVFSYELDAVDVFTDLNVLGIYPPVRLRIRIDNQISRTLPVHLVTDGELPANLGYLVPLSTTPDSVRVSGPERFFANVTSVDTAPLNLGQISASRTVEVKLLAPHDELVVQPTRVGAVCRVARLEERTLANIPVIPLVDAGRPEVGISPPVADVMVRGVVDSVRTLTEARFAVTVAVGDLPEGMYVLSGQVEYPPWLTLIGLDPAEFQVIVGQPAAATGDTTHVEADDGR